MADNMGMPPLEEPKKNNKTLIIVIVALVVICCCCAAIGGLYSFGDQIMNALGVY